MPRIAPERDARAAGKRKALKIAEKESPMTIVYCRDAEAQSSATDEDGIHDVLSPTVCDHALPKDSEFVAAQTLPIIVKL